MNMTVLALQLEAAMCPMTMYELGKAQKLNAEVTSQLQTCNLKTAMLMREKAECEAGKAVSKSKYCLTYYRKTSGHVNSLRVVYSLQPFAKSCLLKILIQYNFELLCLKSSH